MAISIFDFGMEKYAFFAVLLLFLASFSLSGTIYSNYGFPLVADAWDHVSIVQQIVSGNSPNITEPYYSSSVKMGFSENPELGFHLISSIAVFLTGYDAVFVSTLIPSIATFLLALGVFVLVRYLLKSSLAGTLSGLFVLSMKSSIFLLGFQYFVPMAFGLAFIPFLVFLFFRARTSKKFALLFFFGFFLTSFIYPVYNILLLPLFVFYFLLNRKFFSCKSFFLTASILLILLAMFLLYWGFLSQGGIEGGSFFDAFFFRTYSFSETQLNVFSALNPVVLLFAVFGFIGIVFLKTESNSTELVSLLFEIFFMLFLFLEFKFYGIAFLAPVARLFSGFSLMIAVFAGMGLYFLWLKFFSTRKAFFSILCIALFGAVLGANFFDPNRLVGNTFYLEGEHGMRLVEHEELPALELLKNVAKNSTVLSMPFKGRAVHVLSGAKVSPVPAARLGTPDSKLIEGITVSLEGGNCNAIKAYLEKFNASFIYQASFVSQKGYAFKEISCPNILKIYSMKSKSKEIGIYSFKKE